jgi:peptidoglycan/LPS O-acetylase OafA/YrhL
MKKSIHLPNLNGLRFVAAFIVILSHFGQFNVLSTSSYFTYFGVIGKLGVVLFFTLSGFLITYLLLIEKKET